MDQQAQEAICARIKQARVEAGMTLEEMAHELNITLRAYWNYENNRVPFKRLSDIATITGTTQEWLLRGEASPRFLESPRELVQGMAAALRTLEDSQESVHEKLDEVLNLLQRLEAASSSDSEPQAPQHKHNH